MIAVITRTNSNDKQTLGRLYMYDLMDKEIFTCCTLELSNNGNRQGDSRIPEGSYNVVQRISPSLGLTFHIQDVPDREFILIHSGNYYSQIKGCVLVGDSFVDINHDGQLDVTNSRATLNTLLELADEFQLTITDIEFLNA